MGISLELRPVEGQQSLFHSAMPGSSLQGCGTRKDRKGCGIGCGQWVRPGGGALHRDSLGPSYGQYSLAPDSSEIGQQ